MILRNKKSLKTTWDDVVQTILLQFIMVELAIVPEMSAEEDLVGGGAAGMAFVGAGGSQTKREAYKAQLHETLGSIDESIEISQVHTDADSAMVGVHKSNSTSSGKVRKGSLVLVDSTEGTVSSANGTTTGNSTNV
ncbi:hypothetical protein BIW11_14140 [Tropilaelaps mercedesae]|uniref:Uncharacterized protein n=1 Tax=Tropilaelaps mercedesae TaxID=418985 RepID=A0A1V9WZ16_9ACAR|nr:hypothetical protein BIW11_14140 [Tropilaelaps mercedesae]